MSASSDIIDALVAAGMDATDAALMLARAAVEMNGAITRKSPGAVRQQRYRERHKASQSVTQADGVTPQNRNETSQTVTSLRSDASRTVTNRNESVTRDVSDETTKSFSLSPVPLLPPTPPNNPLTPKPSSKNSLSARDFGDWPQDFKAVFWEAWPNRVGKQLAMRSLEKVRSRGISFAVVMAGVDRYIRDKPSDRSWMNPATFLNGDRWEDQPAKTGETYGQSISNHRADPTTGRATAREARHVSTMGNAALRYLEEGKSAGQIGETPGRAGLAEGFDLRGGSKSAH